MTELTGKIGVCRRGFLAGVIALGAAGAGCSGGLYSYRYRLIVEVETPEGLRTGSSVIEVLLSEGSGIPNTNLSRSYRGEAAAVDLPNGQTLFALPVGVRDPDGFAVFAEAAFHPRMQEQRRSTGFEPLENRIRRLQSQRGRRVLPRIWVQGENGTIRMDSYPLLVRFADIRDPKSVERVDPDDLKSSFGDGYKLKGIYVEMTSDEVGNSMKRRLPWLVNYSGRPIAGPDDGLGARDLIEDINGQSFSTEAFK